MAATVAAAIVGATVTNTEMRLALHYPLFSKRRGDQPRPVSQRLINDEEKLRCQEGASMRQIAESGSVLGNRRHPCYASLRRSSPKPGGSASKTPAVTLLIVCFTQTYPNKGMASYWLRKELEELANTSFTWVLAAVAAAALSALSLLFTFLATAQDQPRHNPTLRAESWSSSNRR